MSGFIGQASDDDSLKGPDVAHEEAQGELLSGDSVVRAVLGTDVALPACITAVSPASLYKVGGRVSIEGTLVVDTAHGSFPAVRDTGRLVQLPAEFESELGFTQDEGHCRMGYDSPPTSVPDGVSVNACSFIDDDGTHQWFSVQDFATEVWNSAYILWTAGNIYVRCGTYTWLAKTS